MSFASQLGLLLDEEVGSTKIMRTERLVAFSKANFSAMNSACVRLMERVRMQ